MKKTLFFFVCFLFVILFIYAERGNSLSLEGRWLYSFSCDNSSCYISGDRIVNRGVSQEPFKIVFFLSKYPYFGGTIYGYEVGFAAYTPLQPNYQYENICFQAERFRDFQPPSATYYPVILILQKNNIGEYAIVDFLSFDSLCHFRNTQEEQMRRTFPYRIYGSSFSIHFAQEVCFHPYDDYYPKNSTEQAVAELADSIVNLTDSILRLTVSGYGPPPKNPPPRKR